MRVISQDGAIDVPYDYFSLSMSWAKIASGKVEDRNVFSIVCHNLSSPNGTKLAEYSTEEKAKKAMEMLRIAYAGKFITNADIPEDFNETIKTAMKGGFGTVIVKDSCDRVEFNNLNGYFQFPKEEELE